MNGYPEYRGMSFAQASREGERLSALPSGWYRYWHRLETLRSIMDETPTIMRFVYSDNAPIDATGWAEAAMMTDVRAAFHEFDRAERV